MKEAWETRRASLHDRDALADLCRAAVAPDDYVIDSLEDLILRGVMCLALDGDRIVGAMHYSPTIEGNAWLGAARTHPEYRRRGVASALLENFVGVARRSGVRALRLWSSATNVSGTASVRASGFREVAQFSRIERKAEKGHSLPSPLPFGFDLANEIRESSLARLGNGYVPYERYFILLTPANVHLLANAGALYPLAGGVAILSRHPEDDPADSLDFGLVQGNAEKLLRALPAAAGSMGAKVVRGSIPLNHGIVSAARKAGFTTVDWGKEVVLYERQVEVGPTSYRKRRTYAEIAAGKREGYAALASLAGKHGHGHTGPHEDRWNG